MKADSKFLRDNLKNIQFSLLPYGTGNDLAQSFGWGCEEGEWSNSI
jgi:hypothetical protein